jgi:hypothetical protein
VLPRLARHYPGRNDAPSGEVVSVPRRAR